MPKKVENPLFQQGASGQAHDYEPGLHVPGFDVDFGVRLKRTVEQIGSQKAAGEIAGVKPEMIGKYIGGKAKPSFFAIRALAAKAGISLDWIATGKGAPEAAPSTAIYPGSPWTEDVADDVVLIPRYGLTLADGTGSFTELSECLGHVPFSGTFLSTSLTRCTPSNLIALVARGDSMEPTICDQDLVLIDTGEKDLQGGLMAFACNGNAYVKRLRPLIDGGIEIVADNHHLYPSQIISNERLGHLHIVGRVRWVGKLI